MEIKPITNILDYKKSKEFVKSHQSNNLSNDEKTKLNVISILIEDFERKGNPNLDDVVIEPLIDQVFDMVNSASKLEKSGLLERGLKLGEEYGELSAELLKLLGYKKSDLSKDQIKYNILLESTDCLIMIFDIMLHMGFEKKEICDMANKQINKWLNINRTV